MGKFDWGFRYVIIFLWVQFWIRLAAVSYGGKKVRTVASSVVRSVNTSFDTLKCIRNESQYAICVVFTTRLHYKAMKIIFCDIISQITHNYNGRTGHGKMAMLYVIYNMAINWFELNGFELGMDRDHGDNQWKFRNHVIV